MCEEIKSMLDEGALILMQGFEMICVSMCVTTHCEIQHFMDVSQATSMHTWQLVHIVLCSHALIVAAHEDKLHTDAWGEKLFRCTIQKTSQVRFLGS